MADSPPAALRLLCVVLLAAPLVVLPGHVDFARLPQQAFVVVSALVVSLLWVLRGGALTGRATRLDLSLLAFLVWSAVSALASAEPAAGLARLGQWTACALVFAVVSRAARMDDVPRLASALLMGGAAAAAVGLGQVLFGATLVPQAAAPAATLANRNVAAGYMAVLAPLALLAGPGRAARLGAAAAACTMAVFLPFTGSRAAAVAVGVQALLLVALRERASGRRALGQVSLALCVAGLALGAAVRLSVVEAAKARSAEIRWSLAGSALSMARDHPLLGVGLGRFGALYPSHGPPVTSAEGAPLRVESPHNEGLQVLAEAGLPGLLAGLWVAARSVRALGRLRASREPAVRRAALAVGLSLAGLAVDGAFGFPLRSAVPPLVLAVLLGLVAALDVREASEAHRPIALVGPAARFAAAVGLSVALAGALSWSVRRLEDDRSLYRRAFLPVAHAQSITPHTGPGAASGVECRPGVTLEARADGRIDLVTHAAPLADVLSCLAEKLRLRLEYQGRPPRQSVSVSLRGQTPAVAVASLLEGLGVDYLLGLDPSRTRVDQLVVLDSSRGPAPSPGTSPPALGEGRIASPPPVGEAPDLGTDIEPPGAGEGEPVPPPFEPAELTPMTLQLSPRPGSADLRPGSPGNRNGLGS